MKTNGSKKLAMLSTHHGKTGRYRQLVFLWTIIIIIGLRCACLQAVPAVFTIDPAQSRLTLGATLLGMTVSEQSPGSLATTLSGRMNAEVTATTIQFTGASLLEAMTNGAWQPLPGGDAGVAPADFGSKVDSPLLGTVQAAVRDIVMDLQSAVLPLQGADFDGSQVQFIMPTNAMASFDFRTLLVAGRKTVSGVATNRQMNGAAITSNGNVQTITLSIDTQFPFTALVTNDSLVSLTGKIVATRPLASTNPAPLVIQSITPRNNQYLLRMKGIIDATCRVESSLDLRHWTTSTYEASIPDACFTVPRNPLARAEYFRIAR